MMPSYSIADLDKSDTLFVGRENLNARAYIMLRKALMTGRLRPGQKLLLKPLADELGVSVTPVREALMRLASENGVVADRSRTMMVPILSLARFIEIRDIRAELEGRAAAAAAKRIKATDLNTLELLHQQLMEARSVNDVQRALSLNEAFHFKIYQISDSPVLFNLIESLWVQIGPVLSCLTEYARPQSFVEHPHDDILRALKNHEEAAAHLALVNDILSASRHLEKVVVELNKAEEANHAVSQATVTAD